MNPDIAKTRAEFYRPLIEAGLKDGLHANALRDYVGISRRVLIHYIKILGLPDPPRKKRVHTNPERARRILAMRQAGSTLEEIGSAFGITRERVRQLLLSEHPDITIQPRIRSQVACNHCDSLFSFAPGQHDAFCSVECRTAFRKSRRGWDRDRAEAILTMRNQGLAWSAIAAELTPGTGPAAFRAALQHQIPILFSSAEQQRYFPKHGAGRFRTPDGALTSNRPVSGAA
jgi:DNA-binding transcriptional MerR regulator